MPSQLCVGNGNLLVNFDSDLNIKDMYFPFVGMGNHVSGNFCRFGIWAEKRFSWIYDPWSKRLSYKEDSLITDVSVGKPDLSLELRVEDEVNHFHNLFLEKVTLKNTAEKEREVRLSFSHYLHLSDTDKGITAYDDPNIHAIIHFR